MRYKEVDPKVIAAELSPLSSTNVPGTQPFHLDVNISTKQNRSSFIPLCLIMNCRSIMNKADNVNDIMWQICPDLILAVETWERATKRLDDIIKNKQGMTTKFFQRCGTSPPYYNFGRWREILELSKTAKVFIWRNRYQKHPVTL